MRQLGEQHRGLQRVEAAVGADFIVEILPGSAVQPEPPEPLGQRIVLATIMPAVAPGAQVLAGEEGEACPSLPSSPAIRHSPSILRRAPIACAASSMTGIPWCAARGRISSISTIWPNRWTTMIARVRGVMAASMAAGEMLNVTGSMSTKTGVPPALWMVPAVAKKVKAGVMTSSPGFRSSASKGSSRASVPLAQPIPCLACDSRAISASRAAPRGP